MFYYINVDTDSDQSIVVFDAPLTEAQEALRKFRAVSQAPIMVANETGKVIDENIFRGMRES